MFKITLILLAFNLILCISCNDNSTDIEEQKNTTPIASLTVYPDTGKISTLFYFDAQNSNDIEDDISDLRVRWDWENDGIWDTDYLESKTFSFRYDTIGVKIIQLEVKDTGNLKDSTTYKILVTRDTTGMVEDIDGNVYRTILIGEQWWMAENLKVTHYQNGDAIPNITDKTEWERSRTGGYCSYNNDNSNISPYGLLYNWKATNDSRKIAPKGWHVPTDDDWKELEMYLGMSQSDADETSWRGTNEGDKLKSTSGWNGGYNGTNSSGFSALPGGFRDYFGNFANKGFNSFFWSAKEDSTSNVWCRRLYIGNSEISRDHYYNDTPEGLSIRCIKN